LKLKQGRIPNAAMADIGDQLLAMGIGNLVLDMISPRKEGPRLPQIAPHFIQDVDEDKT
jgi:hypothetical protein